MPEITATSTLKPLLKFPFQGPDWRNRLLIGTAVTLAGFFVPLLPMVFVYGYTVAVMRQAIQGQGLELPAWDDWGKLGLDGLRLLVVGLAYTLPGILVLSAGWFLYMVTSFAFPLLMSNAGGQGGGGMAALAVLALFGSLAILMLSMTLGFILILLALIPLPAAMAHFAAQDKVAAAFRVREWWPLLRANRSGYFAAWVVVFGLITILNFAVALAYYSVVLCCLIPFLAAPAAFYISVVALALFGQTYRESRTIVSSLPLGGGGLG
jgi:hypothetical protein